MKTTQLRKSTLVACIIFLFSSMIITAQKQEWVFNYKIANTAEELSKIMDNPEANIVRSVADFKQYVQSNPKLRKVFAKKGLLKAVASTMKFNKRGLKTFSYKSLKEVYPDRIKDILSEITPGFGFGSETLGVDYDGYACVAKGTCETEYNSICIGDNC
ncbi:hypothetical protein [uncultured Aquimarina sp.]|uniref:hypothetical protein n=1 Tax=uncultured Aquimarina sp. TaxID=575652 RepID=UPI0026200384|nr:hypothetical protein [uncultured Aquimarina sp.]